MRKTETMARAGFEAYCPEELYDELMAALNEWEGGDTCTHITCTVDSLGRLDGESSPAPA